jgi:hypothetical protein
METMETIGCLSLSKHLVVEQHTLAEQWRFTQEDEDFEILQGGKRKESYSC